MRITLCCIHYVTLSPLVLRTRRIVSTYQAHPMHQAWASVRVCPLDHLGLGDTGSRRRSLPPHIFTFRQHPVHSTGCVSYPTGTSFRTRGRTEPLHTVHNRSPSRRIYLGGVPFVRFGQTPPDRAIGLHFHNGMVKFSVGPLGRRSNHERLSLATPQPKARGASRAPTSTFP
jgi:hypothetical protein